MEAEPTIGEIDLEWIREHAPDGWMVWKVNTGTTLVPTWCAKPPWASSATVEVNDETGGGRKGALDAIWLQQRQHEDKGLPSYPQRKRTPCQQPMGFQRVSS